MGDLDKNIHRKNESAPYEKIVVHPIEKERREKEGYKSLKNSTKTQVFATLTSYFKKILNAFGSKSKLQAGLAGKQHIFENLLALRLLLFILSQSDQSHNPEFTAQISELWHNLQDDCNVLLHQSSSELDDKIKFFMIQVHKFPPGADHTLGYYFTEYAGKDWIPFPFMELLQGLHQEYQASPPISVLQNWLLLLDDIFNSAGIKIDS